MKQIIVCIAILYLFGYAHSVNKYSEEMNSSKYYRRLENPFRMQKINLMWEKAQKKLPEGKLKALYVDLLLQDKEEIQWKKLKSADQDEDGLKEAALRKSMNANASSDTWRLLEGPDLWGPDPEAIIKKYGLVTHYSSDEENTMKNQVSSDLPEQLVDKRVFKDKKLNKLWTKVEKGDFTDKELITLKEEFQHHQEKLDQYYQLIDQVNKDPKRILPDEMDNSIDVLLQEESRKKSAPTAQQLLKDKYTNLKSGYDTLVSKVSKGKPIAFEESRVDKLWKLALQADFTPSELDSLKNELHHYEHRLKKLKYLEADLDFSNERHSANEFAGDKTEMQENREQRVKDYSYKVNKIHNELESRILQRHLEL